MRLSTLAWLVAGVSLLACNTKPAETRDDYGAARQALNGSGQFESAGLVALGDGPGAMNLGSHSRLELDRGITNGGLTLN